MTSSTNYGGINAKSIEGGHGVGHQLILNQEKHNDGLMYQSMGGLSNHANSNTEYIPHSDNTNRLPSENPVGSQQELTSAS
jgi:hypothetical protein